MLNDFIKTAHGRRRHLATPLGEHLDGYLAHLAARGFKTSTMYTHLKDVTAFGEYLVSEAIDSAAAIDESTIEAFVEWYLSTPRRTGPPRGSDRSAEWIGETLRGSLRRLLGYLRERGKAPRLQASEGRTPYDDELEEYLSFLREHRGFSETTVEQHRRHAATFFDQLARHRPPVALSELTAGDVEDAAVAISAGLGVRCHQIMVSTIESLIRHLRGTGQAPAECAPFLPKRRRYALAALPSTIPWEQVERAVESIDRSTAMGRRDYALLQLVAVYGLRAGEVVSLSLEDIDWRGGVVRIRQTKTLRLLELPLVPRVADAVIDYLRRGRPETDSRRVFLKCNAPIGPISRTVLYGIVRKTLRDADIEAPHYGPHILRHARATSLLRSGSSLKVVGDILGHRVPTATMIYCKLAVDDLREVALELPEVTS